MSTREIPMGAHSRPLASHTRADTQPGLKFLSAQELVSSPPYQFFHFPKLRKAALDVLLIGGAVALICSVAAAIPLAVFLMMFASF